MAAKEAARKEGITYSVGQVDPELEGYSGKTWASRRGIPGLEGAASGGYNPWGVSAGEVGGDREQTRGMGSTSTQTERGYTTYNVKGDNKARGTEIESGGFEGENPFEIESGGFEPGAFEYNGDTKLTVPNIYGDLATGGEGRFNSRDINTIPLGPLRGMLGFGGDKVPTGRDYVPSSTWEDGQFQMADLYDYSKMHPWLWRILKGAGSMVLPGAGTIGSAFVQQGVPRGVGDGRPGNASFRRIENR